jgi:hypothetical protein
MSSVCVYLRLTCIKGFAAVWENGVQYMNACASFTEILRVLNIQRICALLLNVTSLCLTRIPHAFCVIHTCVCTYIHKHTHTHTHQFATDRHQYKILNVSPPLGLNNDATGPLKDAQPSATPPTPSNLASSPVPIMHADASNKLPAVSTGHPTTSLVDISRRTAALNGAPRRQQVGAAWQCV